MDEARVNPQEIENRLSTIEADNRALTSDVGSLSRSVDRLIDKTDELIGRVEKTSASAGRVPTGTIISVVSVFVAILGFVSATIVIIGSMALDPVKQQVSGLQNDRKATVEQLLPNLASSQADIIARVRENETELNLQWAQTFEQLYRNGYNQKSIEIMEEKLAQRISDHDGAQNAEIDHLKQYVAQLAELITSGQEDQ